MKQDFFGRKWELERLNRALEAVRQGGSRPGECLIVSGRRRVGKTRLVQEFVTQSGLPSVFFTASELPPDLELENFQVEVANSDLPNREIYGPGANDWNGSLRLFAQTLPQDQPTIVVIDELPYLTKTVESFEGILQTVWDRIMFPKPVLLILIGSDVSIMESINSYERPFHQRGTPMKIGPLTPADIAEMAELEPAEAFDAYLITGGLPLLCSHWEPGMTRSEYLRKSVSDATSPLVVAAPLNMEGEFRPDTHAATILPIIATHERAYNAIKQRSDLPDSTFKRAMDALLSKGIITADQPLSTKSTREKRYRISDPYLRFWFHFLKSHLGHIDRSRPELVMDYLESGWSAWRGRAVEPLIRESLARLHIEDAPWEPKDAAEIGSFWTRSNDVEVDLVAADRSPVANQIGFVGSIKWYESKPFCAQDFKQLARSATRIPGVDAATPLVAVSRVPVEDELGAQRIFTPDDLMKAWR